MMKIDAHQHFWRYDSVDYAWIDDNMSVLKKDRLPENLYPELKANDFDGCIAIQARQTPEENIFLADLKKENDFIKGFVGWVDLQADNVEQLLDEVSELPGICGIRHIVQDEPDLEFLLRPNFKRGISQLKTYDLCYDVLIFPRHLPVAVKFVEAFPEQKFVLDHIAKPNIKDRILHPWDEHIKHLAQHPNVYCKLSGMVTETEWHNWKADDFKPYLDVIFESFGMERLMIGSDWPVCTVSGSYHEVVNIVDDYLASFSEEVKENVLGQNVIRFYGL